MTVCAALAAGFLARGAFAREPGPRAETAARLELLAARLESVRAATGALPSSAEGIDSVSTPSVPSVDAWGRPFIYIRVAGGFWLMSWGADGVPGGTGDAEDVVHISR
jgi:hypothetical protein